MLYSEIVSLQSEYTYSANVELDIRNDIKLQRFIPNKKTIEMLSDFFVDMSNQKSMYHSRILYGSYGTGKSHFLTVLSVLLSKRFNTGNAFKTFIHRVSTYDKALAADIMSYESDESRLPYLIVPIESDYPDFNTCVYQSLRKVLQSIGVEIIFKNFYTQAISVLTKWEANEASKRSLEKICEKYGTETNALKNRLKESDRSSKVLFENIFSDMTYGVNFVYEVESLTDAINQANKTIENEYSGIVFVFDEFGRYLEDYIKSIKVKYIQNLAEFCDHGDYNNHIILVSHKEISLYTRDYGKKIVDEWKKIEGRFNRTSMNTTSEQCLSLIKDIIVKNDANWETFKRLHSNDLIRIFDKAAEFKGFLINEETGYDFFEGGFPVHPISLYSLDKLSKKIAQNERTFFTFLASKERNSLYDFLINHDTEDFHFVGMDQIYDYFEPNIKSHQTSDAYDIYKKLQIALSKNIHSKHLVADEKLLKTIALISIINDDTALFASEQILLNSIDYDATVLKEALSLLVDKKILIYKETYERYEFYDASIFDINQLIEENINNITDSSVTNVLNSEFVDFILYPRSYNFQYKINRSFIPVFLRIQDFNRKTLSKYLSKYYDGVLIMLLCKKDEVDLLSKDEINFVDRSIVFTNYDGENLIKLTKKYLSICYLESIKANYVSQDPTFDKELSFYKEDAKEAIENVVSEWRTFKLESYQVFSKNTIQKIGSVTELSAVASSIMYEEYSKTLIVNNELINKNIITATINSAQKKAVQSVLNGNLLNENYGLYFLSPEYLIVRSVLAKNGIIRGMRRDSLNKLPDGSLSGAGVIKVIHNFIEKSKKASTVFEELYNELKQPPFGLRDGYLPILLSAILYSEKKGLVISSHNIEKEFSYDTICEMIRRPDEYQITIVQWNRSQQEFLNNIYNRFKSFIDSNNYSANSTKAIYEGMFLHFRLLSKFSRTTERYVSEKAIQYRRMMMKSYTDYSKFFLKTLKDFGGDYNSSFALIEKSCDELDNSLNALREDLLFIINNVFSFDSSEKLSKELAKKYRQEWREKKNKSFDYYTNSFLDFCLKIDGSQDDYETVDSISRIVTGFSCEYWNDSNIDEFESRMNDINNKLSAYRVTEDVKEHETKVTIQSATNQKTMIFDKTKLESLSLTLKNKIMADIDRFGMSISYDDKLQILLSLLEELMEGK